MQWEDSSSGRMNDNNGGIKSENIFTTFNPSFHRIFLSSNPWKIETVGIKVSTAAAAAAVVVMAMLLWLIIAEIIHARASQQQNELLIWSYVKLYNILPTGLHATVYILPSFSILHPSGSNTFPFIRTVFIL